MTMDASQAVDLCRQTLMLAVMLAAPVLLIGAVVGIATGLFQTLFQIQDQSISFVPKLIASCLVLLACLPWIFSRMIEFTQQLYLSAGM